MTREYRKENEANEERMNLSATRKRRQWMLDCRADRESSSPLRWRQHSFPSCFWYFCRCCCCCSGQTTNCRFLCQGYELSVREREAGSSSTLDLNIFVSWTSRRVVFYLCSFTLSDSAWSSLSVVQRSRRFFPRYQAFMHVQKNLQSSRFSHTSIINLKISIVSSRLFTSCKLQHINEIHESLVGLTIVSFVFNPSLFDY